MLRWGSVLAPSFTGQDLLVGSLNMDAFGCDPITNNTKRNNKENTMAKGQSLQDPFLNALRKERVPVSIYLVNGIKLQGQTDSFDQFVVLLKNSVSQMVYKHAISTVVPARAVTLQLDGGDNG